MSVYLVAEASHAVVLSNVYKIGMIHTRTLKKIKNRLNAYGNNAIVFCLQPCNNPRECESLLIQRFSSLFEYGGTTERFKGNIEKMIETFNDVVWKYQSEQRKTNIAVQLPETVAEIKPFSPSSQAENKLEILSQALQFFNADTDEYDELWEMRILEKRKKQEEATLANNDPIIPVQSEETSAPTPPLPLRRGQAMPVFCHYKSFLELSSVRSTYIRSPEDVVSPFSFPFVDAAYRSVVNASSKRKSNNETEFQRLRTYSLNRHASIRDDVRSGEEV
jgi:hypothetical protein